MISMITIYDRLFIPVCETSFLIHRFEVERRRFLAFSSSVVFCSDRDGRFGVEGKGLLKQKNILSVSFVREC